VRPSEAVVELGYFNREMGRKVPAERQAESREAKRGGKQGTSTKVVDNDFQQKRTCLKTHFGYPTPHILRVPARKANAPFPP